MKYRIEYISTFYTDVLQTTINLEEYPQKAQRIFAKLDKNLTNLANMPEMYPVYEDFPVFRKITIEDYSVFYIINKHNRVVEIHRLIYSRMNIKRHLTSVMQNSNCDK